LFYYISETANVVGLLLIQFCVREVVAVRFYENWLLATYFIKWMHKWRQQEAIAHQSEFMISLAASVRCRRIFAHWKHRIFSCTHAW